MAGIGFEIRKLLTRDSYFGLLQAYTYAGVISSGPWVLSILGVLLVGVMSFGVVAPDALITQFQVSVTYVIAVSLILTGFLQLAFTRYIADRLFDKQEDRVLPNFMGALFVTTLLSGLLAYPFAALAFTAQSTAYKLLLPACFVVMCDIWVATIFLSGMKRYKAIVGLFALGYGVTVSAALLLRFLDMEGLLAGFLIGHFVLLTGMMLLVLRDYPSDRFIEFDFLRRGRMFATLIWVGFVYNLAVWTDKFLFWYSPDTGEAVIGPLHASVVYDFPIFLAYLSIIPGMAVFLVRMETDFVEYYQRFYDAVRDGGTLQRIEDLRNEMVLTARQGIFEIFKIQTIAVLATFVAGPALLSALGISKLYLPLLQIDVVAAGLQVVLLGILNVFFYLDKRREVLGLTLLFLLSNFALTAWSLSLGAAFYGYGFAASLLLTVVAGLVMLDRKMETLEYETFMLQR
jgi:uncharacterized membrane protein